MKFGTLCLVFFALFAHAQAQVPVPSPIPAPFGPSFQPGTGSNFFRGMPAGRPIAPDDKKLEKGEKKVVDLFELYSLVTPKKWANLPEPDVEKFKAAVREYTGIEGPFVMRPEHGQGSNNRWVVSSKLADGTLSQKFRLAFDSDTKTVSKASVSPSQDFGNDNGKALFHEPLWNQLGVTHEKALATYKKGDPDVLDYVRGLLSGYLDLDKKEVRFAIPEKSESKGHLSIVYWTDDGKGKVSERKTLNVEERK